MMALSPVAGTVQKMKHEQRHCIQCGMANQKNSVICLKCLDQLEEYSEIEIKYRELKNELWSIYRETFASRREDFSAFIHGVAVQTDHVDGNVEEVVAISQEVVYSDGGSPTMYNETITVEADPQLESDAEDGVKSMKQENGLKGNNEKTTYTCSTCGLSLSTEKALLAHHNKDHSDSAEDDSSSHKDQVTKNKSENMKQECNVCNEEFGGLALLRKHVTAEHAHHRLLYKCRTCYKKLTSHGGAAYHGRSHYQSGDNIAFEDVFDFMVQPIYVNKVEPDETETDGDNLIIEEASIADIIPKDDPDSDYYPSSSDDEIPLAAKRKQIIFKKIKKEVSAEKKRKSGKVSNNVTKKALAELQKINGIVVAKVKKEPNIKKERSKDLSLIHRIIEMQHKVGVTEGEDGGGSGEDTVKEFRLPPIKEAKFECEICHKKWKTRGELNAHASTHSDARPYICEKCGQAYKHKHALDVHVGMHNGIYQHQCSYCHKAFTQKGALQRHLPIHTGELPFQCELCGKRFVHRTSFSIHTMAHTGVRHIKCEICNLGVLSKSHLRRHMRIHSGEKPYACSSCGKKFAERYNLVAHRRTHDPMSPAPRIPKKKQHICHLCNIHFCSKQKLEEHLVHDHHKVAEVITSLKTNDAESSDAYLPSMSSRYAKHESDTSKRSDVDKTVEIVTDPLAIRRNMQIIRASVDSQIIRLPTAIMEPSQAWPYLNPAS